jgi:hypothetical protein
VRHGTISLFAAVNIADGRVIHSLPRRHRAAEFRKFLVRIGKAVPAGLDVHLVCDNLATAPEQVRQQLAGLTGARQVALAAQVRPGDPACPAEGAQAAMASVAHRHQQRTAEITRRDAAPGRTRASRRPPRAPGQERGS